MNQKKLLSMFLILTTLLFCIPSDTVLVTAQTYTSAAIYTDMHASQTSNETTGITATQYEGTVYSVNLYHKKAERASEQTSEWNKYSNFYFYNLMPETEQAFYDSLYSMCLDYLENNTAISGTQTAFCKYSGISSEEAQHVASIFYYANPQFYFLKNGYLYSESSDTSGSIAYTVYDAFLTSTDRKAATESMKAGIASYLETIETDDTPYEMELKLHDIIIEKTSYATGTYDQSTYSVFVENATVCAGYAGAYSMLLNSVGIEAISLTSYYHQWNYVRMNDLWYIVDTTWDDFGTSASYDCFNRSKAGMETVSSENYHVPLTSLWNGYIPDCTIDSGSTYEAAASALPSPVSTISAPSASVSVKNGISTVTLHAAHSDALIYYTTDGTVPSVSTTKSHVYTGTFTMSETATLKAVAVCASYYDSPVTEINIKSAAAPSISKQPASETYTYKDMASKLTVSASSSDHGNLTYQWYKASTKSASGNAIKNATSASFTPKTTTAGTHYYYCKVTNTSNGTSASVTSSRAKIVIKAKSIRTASITGISTKTYTGNVIKQTISVKSGTTKLKVNTDYTISYKNNKSIGTATICVTGTGNYAGTRTFTFQITPKKTTVKALTAGYKKVTASWSKVTNATGYQVQTSSSSTFKSPVTMTVGKNTTLSKSIDSLSSKKTYYVRVRSYKTVNGKRYYSGWSSVKSIKTR